MAEEKPSITVHMMNPDAATEARDAAMHAKAHATETRQIVLERHRELVGCTLPVEILTITNCPSHNCLIVNDLLLFSYEEAREFLEQLDDD